MSGISCGCIPPLTITTPRRRTDIGCSNWHEASPGLSPAKCARQKCPVISTPANMAVSLPVSRIPPATAMWSRRCRQTLNQQKVFFARIHPLDPGDHMLSQKLLVDINVNMFANGNRLLVNPQGLPHLLSTSLPYLQAHDSFFILKTMFLL
jgi:hypothetical protein